MRAFSIQLTIAAICNVSSYFLPYYNPNENGITLKISGILKVTDDNTTSSIIYYSEALDNLIIDRVNNSEIIKEQLENKEINVFTGEEFKAGIDLNSPEYL